MIFIEKSSLLRAISVRRKWHKDITVEDIIDMIEQAPEIEVEEVEADYMPTGNWLRPVR